MFAPKTAPLSLSDRVCVLHGVSGAGKTSLMCKAAQELRAGDPHTTVVIRMLGTSQVNFL